MKRSNGLRDYQLIVSLKDNLKENWEDQIILWTNDKDEPKFTVPVKIMNTL
jgi:hypothetical protein